MKHGKNHSQIGIRGGRGKGTEGGRLAEAGNQGNWGSGEKGEGGEADIGRFPIQRSFRVSSLKSILLDFNNRLRVGQTDNILHECVIPFFSISSYLMLR